MAQVVVHRGAWGGNIGDGGRVVGIRWPRWNLSPSIRGTEVGGLLDGGGEAAGACTLGEADGCSGESSVSDVEANGEPIPGGQTRREQRGEGREQDGVLDGFIHGYCGSGRP